jgi:hypothetical protein
VIIGHLGVAFGAQRRWPKAPLGWFLVATMAPDFWRIALSSAGYAWWPSNTLSHTLPWSGIFAATLASFAWLVLRDGKVSLVILFLVASHIGLDMISGWKPLWIGGPSGLNLEQGAPPLEYALEAVLLWLGWRVLPRSRVPRWLPTKTLLLLLLAAQAAHMSLAYNSRPEETRCLAYPLAPCWRRL